jgi:hypothetical protein
LRHRPHRVDPLKRHFELLGRQAFGENARRRVASVVSSCGNFAEHGAEKLQRLDQVLAALGVQESSLLQSIGLGLGRRSARRFGRSV